MRVCSLPHNNLSCTESETYSMFTGKTQTSKMIEKENQIQNGKEKKSYLILHRLKFACYITDYILTFFPK